MKPFIILPIIAAAMLCASGCTHISISGGGPMSAAENSGFKSNSSILCVVPRGGAAPTKYGSRLILIRVDENKFNDVPLIVEQVARELDMQASQRPQQEHPMQFQHRGDYIVFNNNTFALCVEQAVLVRSRFLASCVCGNCWLIGFSDWPTDERSEQAEKKMREALEPKPGP